MVEVVHIPGKRCNNSCFFCTYTGRDNTQPAAEHQLEMHTGVVKAWLREVKDKEDRVVLRGVEPALREDLPELLRYAKQLGIRDLALETNGRAFFYKDLCKQLLREGLKRYTIYIFGPEAQLHDSWSKVKGSFEQTLTGIRNLLSLGAEVKVLCFLSARHAECLQEYAPLLQRLKPSSATFLYIDLEHRNVRTVDQPFVQQLGRDIRDLIETVRNKGIPVEPNDYKGSLDLSAFFDDLQGDLVTNVSIASSKEGNISAAESGFAERSLTLDSKPLKLFVELTRNCNFRCIMCPQPLLQTYKEELDMPFEMFQQIADALFPYATYVDLRGFGESTFIKGWRDYLDYALKFDCKYGLITNLAAKDDEMWKLMMKSNCFLGVSFDGATKKTFEYIRRGANFKTIMRNLRNIVGWREQYQMPEENIKLLVTAQRENIHELPEIVELANEVRVKRVQFSPSRVMYDEGVLNCDHVFDDPEVIGPILERSIALAKKHGIQLEMTGSFQQQETERHSGYAVQECCDHPWTRLYITAEGKAGPCNQLMMPLGILLGDLRHNSFEEVWNNFNFRMFRKIIHTPHRLNYCDWCFKNRYGD